MNKIFGAVVICASLVIPFHSEAAYAVYDSRNYSANIESKLQMIQQVKNSAQQLQYDLKNLQKLDAVNLERSYYRIANAIRTMELIRAQTNAIGTDYTKLMTEYNDINPDYTNWSGIGADGYAKQTDKLRDKWNKALLQSLGVTGIASPNEQYETSQTVEQLLRASQNADGAMGALQAANQLTALMIAEQQKMQVLMADSIRSQNMYYQSMIDAQNQAKQINAEFMKNSNKYDGAKIKGNGSQLHQFKE